MKKNERGVWQSKVRRELNWAYVLLYDEMLGFMWSEETVKLLGRFERILRKTFPNQVQLIESFDDLVQSADLMNEELKRTENLRHAVENMYNVIEKVTSQNNYIMLTK